MYEPLTESTAAEYIRKSPLATDYFERGDSLRAVDLAVGNVNLVFRVYSVQEPRRSVVVKQALPYARLYPDGKMPLERAEIEYEVLQLEGRYCPDQAPVVYLHDPDLHLNVMEDLNGYTIMRRGLMRQIVYPHFAEHIGCFLARTLFYTSDLHLSSEEKKAMVPRFINPVLCKVTEDLVFTEPYLDHPNNHWTTLLDPQVKDIHSNDALHAEVCLLKEAFMVDAQALLHGDLHTGSIMVTQEQTKVIDPEFGFFGPMGFDVGAVLGNLMLSYASQEYHAKDPATREQYRQWLLDVAEEVWETFEADFRRLWATEGNGEWLSLGFREKYIHRLLEDAAGFGAAKMMRRILGLAHVPDLEEIPDEHARAAAESLALNIAQACLMKRHTLSNIGDLTALAREARPSRPFTRTS